MKTLLYFFGSILLFSVFSNCKSGHTYDKYVKELDSLKIVIEQSVANFKTIDSLTCAEAYSKQYTYSGFINSNLKDTVSKRVASDLQSFYALGKNMSNFLAMHPRWISEAQNTIKQLSNLSHDLKNGAVQQEDAIEYINKEKKEAEKIIEELKVNAEVMRRQMELYTKTLPTAEEVARKLNAGQLPEMLEPVIQIQQEIN